MVEPSLQPHGSALSCAHEGASSFALPQPRPVWHIGLETLCYPLAFVMPWLLRPVIHGALPSEGWRVGAMAAVALMLVMTGVCVRVRWPLSWVPACCLSAISSVIVSPWHTLSVSFAALALVVLLATQVLPCESANPGRRRKSSAAPILLILVGSIAVGYAILRMSVVAGFPLSLAQALTSPQVALLYLRDNPHALDERPPGGVPWTLYAAKHADPLVLEAILAAGAQIRGLDPDSIGQPLAWYAANADFSDPHLVTKARMLARYGAAPAGAIEAARRGHHPLTQALIELGDDVGAPDANGRSALGALIEENAVSAVVCLLSNGARVHPGTLRITPALSGAMREVLTAHGVE